MSVTIKDIAKRVGRSVTTVSRALNDYDDVSDSTKILVRQAALEMGYSPNTVAQRLQKRRTDTIGLIIPSFGPRFSDPFFSEFLAGVGNKAASFGYDLLVSTRPPGESELDLYRQMVQGKRVDGFVIVRTRQEDARINYLRQEELPFVAFGRTSDDLDYPFVDEDGALGMCMVIEHLTINLGHRRIACITPPPELNFTQARLGGLRNGLKSAGIPFDDTLVRAGDLTQRGGYQQANVLLSLTDPPTAIAAFNDLMAIGAISAARERGLVVGKDIAITGFDDIPIAEHSNPPLTTINQPIHEIGEKVCEMLIKLIRNEPLEEMQIILKPRLMVRQSCGANSHHLQSR